MTVMTHVIALDDGQFSQGHLSLLHRYIHTCIFVLICTICSGRLAQSFIEDMRSCPHANEHDNDTAPNFLSSLMESQKLDTDRVIAITNELFIAGLIL